ncbi:hypothetical protein TanjilG_19718 [Lupinus angustifolius]|uniref:Methyltransferase-related protein n=1 Tax=Lupinus angustifolius TaxID=3871 RepID=A0A4P1RA95_LUPAN|nr:PREDICTED: uncharacterized protein LOC109353942 [Lupinus angustifolius]OIW06280.1 hypothetical protein TanjilG_19718 [Lupinus angustifolius]
MCPLRFILVFFSTVLAAYFAWNTIRSPETDFVGHDHKNNEHFRFKKMIQNGFWVFIDMASGRYLWRNLKSKNDEVQAMSS